MKDINILQLVSKHKDYSVHNMVDLKSVLNYLMDKESGLLFGYLAMILPKLGGLLVVN